MERAKLALYFDDFSETDFLILVLAIAKAILGNAHFPPPWPVPLLSPEDLAGAIETYEGAHHVAEGGDAEAIDHRKLLRKDLTKELKKAGHYFELVGAGNIEALRSTAYPLQREPVKGLVRSVPAAPTGFRVERGATTTTAIGHAKKPDNAVMYELEGTTGDPTVDSNFTPLGRFEHCNRMEVAGLVALKTYSFRLRGINGVGEGPWAVAGPIVIL